MKIKAWQMISTLVFWPILFSERLFAQPVMSLIEAEQHALQRDAVIQSLQRKEQAWREESVAEDSLPDPRIKLGLMNFPTDTFSRTQEAMTQVQIGIQQAFPRGNSLSLKKRQTHSKADVSLQDKETRKREVLLQLRKNWFEAYYWEQAEKVVKENKKLFKQLVDITKANYASGRRNQQDVTQAQFEFGMLDDRLQRINTMQEKIKANLLKWLGDEYKNRRLSSSWPNMKALPPIAEIRSQLRHHPVVEAEEAKVEMAISSVALSREAYKPAWMLELNYGFRDGNNPNNSERADFASAMLSFDMPLFTGRKQDKKLAASQQRLLAARDQKNERVRRLHQLLDETYANWQSLTLRLNHYRGFLLPKSKENTQAALNAYQSDTTQFTTLMRAQINELETELKSLRLQVDYAKTQAGLFYLAGEKQ